MVGYNSAVLNNINSFALTDTKTWNPVILIIGVLVIATVSPALLDGTLLSIAILNALMLAGWTLIHLQQYKRRWCHRNTRASASDSEVSSDSLQRLPAAFGHESEFVSLHVATYAEPPEVVSVTLLALSQLDYRAFARMMIDPRTVAIAVVDADYQVTPDFLERGMSLLSSRDCDDAQFPQAYRPVSASRSAIDLELADYFECVADCAEAESTMLLTRTLSIVSLLWQAAFSALILIVMAKRGTMAHRLSARTTRCSMNLHAGGSTLQALRLKHIFFAEQPEVATAQWRHRVPTGC